MPLDIAERRASDFVEISLHDGTLAGVHARPGSAASASSLGSHSSDDRGSVGSIDTSPPGLTDASSLRSSLSSISSPSLSQFGAFGARTFSSPAGGAAAAKQALVATPPALAPLAPPQGTAAAHSAADGSPRAPPGRSRTMPNVHDTTSMASMSRLPSFRSSRSRKQREMDYDADAEDDFMPTNGLMFNVPMSPGLYAQQRAARAAHGQGQAPTGAPSHGPSSLNPQRSRSRARRGSNGSLHSMHSMHSVHSAHSGHSLQSSQSSQSLSEDAAAAPPRRPRLKVATSADGPETPRARTRPAAAGHGHGGTPGQRSVSLPSIHEADSRETLRPAPPRAERPRDGPTPPRDVAAERARRDARPELLELDFDAADLTLAYLTARDLKFDGPASPAPAQARSASLPTATAPATPTIAGSPALPGSPASVTSRASLTRPEHLPPKSPAEEKRHMQEYARLMNHVAAAERARQADEERAADARRAQAVADASAWTAWAAKTPTAAARDAKAADLGGLRKLWWRGIPEKVRGDVWRRRAGISSVSSAVATINGPFAGDARAIAADTAAIWPELGIFEAGRPLHDGLVRVVRAWLARHAGAAYRPAITRVAALLLLHVDEVGALALLERLLDPAMLPGAVVAGDAQTAAAYYGTYLRVFRGKFPQLLKHLTAMRVGPDQYLDGMVSSLLCDRLSPDAAARVLDVYLFEGDSFLLRAALGVVRVHEHALYQSRDELLAALAARVTADDDAFMTAVREIARA